MLEAALQVTDRIIAREKLNVTLDKTNPMELPGQLVKWRKRGFLTPADLTALRLAFSSWSGRSEWRKQFAAAISETVLDREMRKDIPR